MDDFNIKQSKPDPAVAARDVLSAWTGAAFHSSVDRVISPVIALFDFPTTSDLLQFAPLEMVAGWQRQESGYTRKDEHDSRHI